MMTAEVGYELRDVTSYLIGDFPDFNQDESLYGCLSMYIPLNTESYNGGDYQYNKTANNFGWNRIIDWSRFGWN